MSNCEELKQITKARLKSAKTLIAAKDWHGAAYMLGYVLECALKAATCKTLHLVEYPENTKNDKINLYFMTHRFEQLLLVSGLEDIFSSRGPAETWKNWSEFTIEYPADWTPMRYDTKVRWDKTKVNKLYNNLTASKFGIISIIKRKKRW
jgi:hypothetical protein